jgi:(1->4)-alpha-D-glucan 1-alpha-D-glucosylmutase
MPISDHQGLDALCAISGITDAYYDIRGQRHEASIEVKQSLLAAMDLAVDNDSDIQHNLEKVNSAVARHIVAPTLVHKQCDMPIRMTLTLVEAQVDAPISWELHEESGQRHQGRWEIYAGDAVNETELNGIRLLQFEVNLPAKLDIGYHRLSVKTGDDCEAQASLIVTPTSCYQPPELDGEQKIWGVSLQLYALRSQRNWGIGDFTDLHAVIEILAPLGVDAIGLNPLHALFTLQADRASPYSPSSRDFLNPVYLDVEAIDEFAHCQEARQHFDSQEFQARLQALRSRELIDYSGVWTQKFEILKMLYRQFRSEPGGNDSARAMEFQQFQRDGGEDLSRFTLFEALQSFFQPQDGKVHSWRKWPAAFRDPDSDTVAQWAASNIDAIEFHQYLQWNADLQLSGIHERCNGHGMCIGIYRDLAVGNARSGAQCWADQSQYALDTGIGAPPDDFNLNGQDWGLPPLKPAAIAEQGYRQFIQTMRANMRHAGALRIDHVMGLMRLFWVPPNSPADQGTYVAYPFTDLLGILALESQRNRCLIIGEDLGTVPDEVRYALDAYRILSYRILFFEKDWQRGRFKPPQDYPRYALCSASSHDLPTLRGFWRGNDLDIREQLDLYPSDDIKHQQQALRQQDRREIIAALARENLLPNGAWNESESAIDLDSGLFLSIERYLARSNAALLMVQLEDLLLQVDQVNVPGTVDEYPNWRRKLSLDLETWRDEHDLEGIAHAINRERGLDI